MKKILITGARSYIGTSFEEWMKQFGDDYQIDTLDMRNPRWKEFGFSSYDTIIHLAAIVHVKEIDESLYFKVNCDLAYEVATKAKKEGVSQFIFFSTISVYGLIEGEITRSTPYIPINGYGKSKLKAEKELNELSDNEFKLVIVRPPMVYGNDSPGNYFRLKKLAMYFGVLPKINNSRSMIYIGNLCSFLHLVVEKQLFGIFHPQNAEFISTNDMIKEVRKIHNKKTFVIFNWLSNFIVNKISFGIVKKIYGNLEIEKEISDFNLNYNIFNFNESIYLSESGKR